MILFYITATDSTREVAQLLLQHNADIEVKGKYNQRPYAIAAYSNSIEVSELFIQHNANIEAWDEVTFLHKCLFTLLHGKIA